MYSPKNSLNENEVVASNSQQTEKKRTNILLGLHGQMYQIKLLLWHLILGVSKYKSVRLSTELKEAQKFDDIIFEYVENNKKIYRLVQIKHKRDKKKTLNDEILTLKNRGDFSLVKYFNSYEKLQKEEMFQQGEIKDIVIFTNIDFDLEMPVTLHGSDETIASNDILIKLKTEDDILNFKNYNRQPALYKFNEKMIPYLQKTLEIKGFGIGDDKSLENITKFYNIVKEFFDHLVFAVNQPHVHELDEIIKSYINKNFGYLPNNAYEDLLFEMQKWVDGIGDESLSLKELNKWFETLKKNLDKTIIERYPTLEFESKINNEKILFKSQILQQNLALAKFLSLEDTTHQIFHFVSDETKFTSIKVFQVLQNFEFKNNYYFFQLKYILENKEDFFPILKINNLLLIIECTAEENPIKIEAISSYILNELKQNTEKKIILITKPDDKFAEILKDQMEIMYKREQDAKLNFTDLEVESQTQLLEKTVVFQGIETNLGTLIENIDRENLIDMHTLRKLINNNEIKIGKPLMGLLDVENYFINRTFRNNSQSNSKTRTEFEDEIVIITGEPGVGKSTILTQIAKKFKKADHKSWIARINLLDYVEQFSRWKEKIEKIEIEPVLEFMFKNILLQEFNKNSIKLIKIEMNNKINMKHNENTIIKGPDLLELKLLIHYYNYGNLIILFDGFDEIAPDYTKNVIEMLKIFKESKVRFWISSRNYNILQELEMELGVVSYTLDKFSVEDQTDFLQKFWKHKLDLCDLDINRCNYFANKLLARISQSINYQNKEFLSIPLHIRMVAECFEDLFKSFYYSKCNELSEDHKKQLNEKMNLGSLYQSFIKKKFYEILNKEKRPWQKCEDPLSSKNLEKQYKEMLDDYTKLALYSMFEEETLKEMFPYENMENISSLLEQINEGDENVGIIVKIVNEKPFFVHMTFAEYFIADYIWMKFKSISRKATKAFIKNVIIKNTMKSRKIQICKFFQSIATEDLNSKQFKDKNFKINQLLCMILKNETAKSIIFIEEEIILLISIVESALETSADNYQEILQNIQKLKIDVQIRLLNISAKSGYKNIVTYSKFFLNTNDFECHLNKKDWDENPLFLALRNHNIDIAEMLINEYKIRATWLDKNRNNLIDFAFQFLRSNIHLKTSVIEGSLKLKILDYNTLINIKGTEMPLLVSCIVNYLPGDLIKLLIDKADINIINTGKQFVFHINFFESLFFYYDKEVICLLLDKGLNFNRIVQYISNEKINFDIFILGPTKTKLLENAEFLLEKNVIFPFQALKYCVGPYFIIKLIFELVQLYDKNDSNYMLKHNIILKIISDLADQKPGYKLKSESDGSIWLYFKKDRIIKYSANIFVKPLKYYEIEKKLRENGEVSQNDVPCYFDFKNLHFYEELQNLIREVDEHFSLVEIFNIYSNNLSAIENFAKYIIKVKPNFFFEKIIDLYKKVGEMYSALIKTIEIKNDKELENMLKNMESFYLNSIINGADEKYGSPLHFAVSNDNLKAVQILLQYGANLNKRLKEYNSYLFKDFRPPNIPYPTFFCFQGYLPLHIAALTDNKEMFEMLFQNASENNFKDSFGQTPLHYAAFVGNIEMLQYIISENFLDPSIEDNYGKIFKDYINDNFEIEKMEDFLKTNHSEENVKMSPSAKKRRLF